MAVEKLTKKQKFEMLKALVAENEMLVEFIDHEIELLDKKKSNGNAKANEKMAGEVELVYQALVKVNRAVTPSELIADIDLTAIANPETNMVTPQKVSALVKKLVDCGRVEKYSDKKKTYFRVKAE